MKPEDVIKEFDLDGQDAEIVKQILEGSDHELDRPDGLPSKTTRIDTGYGKMYVTVCYRDGEPYEVALNIGSSGGFINGFTETIAKLATLSLRHGVPPEKVAQKMQGIRSPKIAYDDGEKVLSIPDAAGMVLERGLDTDTPGGHVRKSTSQDENVETETVSAATDGGETSGDVCPECGSQLQIAEGCEKCPNGCVSKC